MLYKFHVMSFVKKSKNQEIAIDVQNARFVNKRKKMKFDWAGPGCFYSLHMHFQFTPPGPFICTLVIFVFLFHF